MSRIINFERLSSHSTPEESLGYLLWHVSTHWRSSIEKILKPHNLTHPQFVVLAATGWLTQKGKLVSQAEIGRTAGLDPNTTSQIIRGLEKKRLIERVRSTDERTKNPHLTNLGSQLLMEALPAVEEADAHFFSSLNPDKSKMLLTIFQKLSKK